jgi:pimeloyl-ACP methyl ester carboxylesterase
MTTFVLVHGGGHGGWCWQPLVRELHRRGHEAYAPTLTGFGERSHLDTSGITFETFVQDVANVLFFEDLRDVVLVGHSMGGVVVPRVAEAAPERIAEVVWLAAVVTRDGEDLRQACSPLPSEWTARAVTTGPDGTAHTDPDLILDAIIQDGTPEQRQWVRDRHVAYPPHALVEPGRLSAFLALDLPTGYVTATEDRVLQPALCAGFADLLPGAWRAEVAAGHDCMLTQPERVADVLLGPHLTASER